MVDLKNGNIFITRGDDVQINISIYNSAHDLYTIQDTDIITFFLLESGSKAPNKKVVFQKTFINNPSNQNAYININADDTLYLSKSQYYYVVVIEHTDADDEDNNYKETVTYGRMFINF